MNKLYYILSLIKKILFLFIIFFSFFYIANGASVDVGENKNIDAGDTVSLSGTISGFENCDMISYYWYEVDGGLNIDQSYELNGASISSSETLSNTGTYTIKLDVSGDRCGTGMDHYSASDTFILNISGPKVYAGEDQNIQIGNIVNLNGRKSGFPSSGCDFTYKWENNTNALIITNSGQLTGVSINTSTQSGAVILEIELEMIVSSSEMTHDSCGKTGTYNDIVNINLTEESSSSGGGRSSYERNKDDADYIFRNDESIGNINMIIEERKAGRGIYHVGWNNIGGIGHIKYEIQYSTGSSFENPEIFETSMDNKMFFEKQLGIDLDIYFFRVRAFYKEKYSSWSNILSITNKINPLSKFNIKCEYCKNRIGYMDVFKSTDLLIEKEFNIKCEGCKKKVGFYDIWKSEDFILEELNTSCLNCDKSVKFDINNFY